MIRRKRIDNQTGSPSGGPFFRLTPPTRKELTTYGVQLESRLELGRTLVPLKQPVEDQQTTNGCTGVLRDVEAAVAPPTGPIMADVVIRPHNTSLHHSKGLCSSCNAHTGRDHEPRLCSPSGRS